MAYRYFATPKRKFIIADTLDTSNTPEHGDRRFNRRPRHHSHRRPSRSARVNPPPQLHASLLGLRHVVVCVNKMDLVDYSEDRFNEIVSAYKNFSSRLDITDIKFIPISALHGDNVVDSSNNTPVRWRHPPSPPRNLAVGGPKPKTADSVQWSSDPKLTHTVISVAMRDASLLGLETWDKVVALPSGKESTIDQILVGDSPLDKAFPR